MRWHASTVMLRVWWQLPISMPNTPSSTKKTSLTVASIR
nr:MAG TPA: hypothetical protein [Caudoviricetes sp.]DAT55058.1 MAG TPA: hypothetical protein [Caudoviricetes sp.]